MPGKFDVYLQRDHGDALVFWGAAPPDDLKNLQRDVPYYPLIEACWTGEVDPILRQTIRQPEDVRDEILCLDGSVLRLRHYQVFAWAWAWRITHGTATTGQPALPDGRWFSFCQGRHPASIALKQMCEAFIEGHRIGDGVRREQTAPDVRVDLDAMAYQYLEVFKLGFLAAGRDLYVP